MGSKRKLIALLQVRWLGQIIDGVFQSALATYVLFSPERQPSAIAAATSFAVVLLPYSIVGPYVGIILDQFSRQKIVLVANAVRAINVVAIALIIKSGATGVLLTLFVLISFGINRLILAGLSAGLPLLTSRQSLITANAWAVTGGTLGIVLGGGMGVGVKGWLDQSFSSDFSSFILLLIAAGGYAITALTTTALSHHDIGPHEDHRASEIHGWREMVAGFRDLRRHRDAYQGIIATAIQRAGTTALTLIGLLLERNTYHSPSHPDAGLKGFAFALLSSHLGQWKNSADIYGSEWP